MFLRKGYIMKYIFSLVLFILTMGVTASAQSTTQYLPKGACTNSGGTLACSNAVAGAVNSYIYVDSYLSNADGHGGLDYGYAANAAVSAAPLTTPTVFTCGSGYKKVWTPIVSNKPIQWNCPNTILRPQSGGASGTWGGSCSGLTPGSYNIAIGGTGLPDDDYVAGCSGTTLTLAIAPKLGVWGIPTNLSNQLCGLPTLLGLATGNTLTGTGLAAVSVYNLVRGVPWRTRHGD
jgi:hypothetical protein